MDKNLKKKNLDKVPVILPKKRNPREANFIVIQTQSSTNQTHPKKKKKKMQSSNATTISKQFCWIMPSIFLNDISYWSTLLYIIQAKDKWTLVSSHEF